MTPVQRENTLTPDLLAHVAEVRDKDEPDDADLLVLAERLDDVGMEQPTEYDPCPKCGGTKSVIDGDLRRVHTAPQTFGVEGQGVWLKDCPACGGNGTVPRPNSLRDRAELLRIQVRRSSKTCPECGGCDLEVGPCGLTDYFRPCYSCKDDREAERDLLARNPAWLFELGAGAEDQNACDGGIPATVTRGFLDITLPHTLCWQEVFPNGCPRCGGDLSESLYCPVCRAVTPEGTTVEPHPVLRAVLAPPVGPWVRRVCVEGLQPYQEAGYESGVTFDWFDASQVGLHPESNVPKPIFDILRQLGGKSHKPTDCYVEFPTAEAATDALVLAVPRWARGVK
jgi:hypothetical protein